MKPSLKEVAFDLFDLSEGVDVAWAELRVPRGFDWFDLGHVG